MTAASVETQAFIFSSYGSVPPILNRKGNTILVGVNGPTLLGVTRQTLYRHVDPRGALRADGTKLLSRTARRERPEIRRAPAPA